MNIGQRTDATKTMLIAYYCRRRHRIFLHLWMNDEKTHSPASELMSSRRNEWRLTDDVDA